MTDEAPLFQAPVAAPSPAPPAPDLAVDPRQAFTRSTALLASALIVAIALGAGIGIGWVGRQLSANISLSTAPLRSLPQSGSSISETGGVDAQGVASKVDPAVVDVNTVIDNLQSSGQAAGTGMVLTSSGEILTNNHVIEGASSIQVSVAGHSSSYTASVVGVDPPADIAVLRIHGVSGLKTVGFADSSTLSVGQALVAIGNAGGEGGAPALSSGAVTALHQTITAGTDTGAPEQLSNLIQTDASVAPGESGGPLVNSSGQVVGMITAAASPGFRFRYSGSAAAYAIPSADALKIVNQIRAGKAGSGVIIGPSGYLGVEVADLDSAGAAQLGLNLSSGALIVGVASQSPAAGAGLARYSVITSAGGTAITSAADLSSMIRAHKPGDRLVIKWTDQSGGHSATVTLTSGPAA